MRIAPSRRGGLRGPRRPRVPLLLLATGSSFDGVRGDALPSRRLARNVGRERGLERPCEGALLDGDGRAGRRPAHVGAAAGQPAGRIDDDVPSGRADDALQLALRARRSGRRRRSASGPARRAGRRGAGARPRLRRHLLGGGRSPRPRRGFSWSSASGLAARRRSSSLRSSPWRRVAFGSGRGRAVLGAALRSSPAAASASAAASSLGRVGGLGRGSAAAFLVARLRLGRRRLGVGVASASASAAGASTARSGLGGASAARRRRRRPRPRPAASAAALASATDTSLRMSIRQPVSRAASRAFWPSRPMASESIRSGTVTDGDAVLLVDVDATGPGPGSARWPRTRRRRRSTG